MKILYTGANGLLGQKISAATPQYSNHAFLATARGKNRTKNLGTASYASMDITDRQGIENVLSEFRPDVIIHGAAMTHVDECEQHKELAYNLNVVGTQNIVDAAKELGAHVVHISTDFIFDGQDGPYNEEGIPNPVSYYGKLSYKQSI
jgi:dTDP-4-dehydrorhamnose reductase